MTGQGNEAGFTLVELLVAITISMIVLGATLDVFAGFDSNSRAVNVKNDSQAGVRQSTDQLVRELRNAVSSGALAPAPLEKAEAYDLIFQTVDHDLGTAAGANAQKLKRVRYCLDYSVPSRERLWKQTQRWTTAIPPAAPSSMGCPNSDWNAWGAPVAAGDRLVNNYAGQSRPVFSYSPTGWSTLAEIVGIRTSLFLNPEPANSRVAAELTSAVRLRNANRAPIVAFTLTQQNGYVLGNASQSQDPDGQALSYQWSLNGTAIAGATNSRLSYPGLVSGSTHTFTLKVTDSGALSQQLSKSVTIQ